MDQYGRRLLTGVSTKCRGTLTLDSFDGSQALDLLDPHPLDDNGRGLLPAMMDDAYRGEFEVVVVWAIDRICRESIEELPRLIRERRKRRCSHLDSGRWLSGSDVATELLAAIAACVAHQESARRSERVQAALPKRRAEGNPMGGTASKRGKDRKPRQTEGYRQAWARRRPAIAN